VERMRDLLKKELGRSLHALSELDRLQAAWPVACGRQLAERGRVTAFADGIVQIEAEDSIWLTQMLSMRATLERELAKIAAVKLSGIHFYLKSFAGGRQ
jgi:predicted nucleic acid-binding Zn ribbon protein